MNSTTDSLEKLTLPLTQSTWETATRFAQQQPTPEKAEQVQRNVLAVYAVRDYCQMMNIPTDLAASDLWHPLKRLMADVADLELVGLGRLECRPVNPTDRTCFIPPEVWADRIGYVAVQLDEAASEATLLGFVPSVTSEYLPLTQLRSIDSLIDQIHVLQQAANRSTTNLGQWLTGQLTAGWQTIESMLTLLNAEPAFAFRGPVEAAESTDQRTRHAKLLQLSTAEVDYPLVLVVEVSPRSDDRRTVTAQLHPIESRTFLPDQLQLSVLDQSGSVLLSTQARSTDDYIQLRLRGLPGEPFRLQIALGDATLMENFVI